MTATEYTNEAIQRSEKFWNTSTVPCSRAGLAVLQGAIIELDQMASADPEFFNAADYLNNLACSYREQLTALI